MNKWLQYIKNFFNFFFVMLGVYYLVIEIESWQSFFVDTKIKFAFIMAIVILIMNSGGNILMETRKKL